jgi:hypothetical protein
LIEYYQIFGLRGIDIRQKKQSWDAWDSLDKRSNHGMCGAQGKRQAACAGRGGGGCTGEVGALGAGRAGSRVAGEVDVYIYIPNKKWLTKISVIYDFSRPFQIINIFCCRMSDKNHELTNVLVSYFLVGDYHIGDE